MSITPGAILLGIALLLIVVLVLARPFLLQRRGEAEPTTREALQTQKDDYLAQIADLDFDHETGKLPATIYEQQRRELLIQAALILRQLDTLENGQNGHTKPAAADMDTQAIDAQIEQAILALRQQRASVSQRYSVDQRPSLAPNGGSQAYCPHCGKPIKPNDNFCRSCGHSLRQQT